MPPVVGFWHWPYKRAPERSPYRWHQTCTPYRHLIYKAVLPPAWQGRGETV
jgi:hypothetical protein